MAAWGLVISVRCRKVPAGLAKVPTWILSSSRRGSGHVPPQAFSAIRGQEDCQPAEGNVGADPVFAPVPDGVQVDDLLYVFPAALDFEQLLVPDGDVFRGQVGVRGAEQVFPVQVFLGFRLRGADPEQAARSNAQLAVQAGPGGDDAAQLGAPAGAELVRVPDHFFELGDYPCPDDGVAPGGVGVKQMTNRSSSAIRTSLTSRFPPRPCSVRAGTARRSPRRTRT